MRGEGVVVVVGDVDDEGVWSRPGVPDKVLPPLSKGDKDQLVLCLCTWPPRLPSTLCLRTRPLKMQATSAVKVGDGVVPWKLMGLLLVGTFPVDFSSAPTMARSALTVMILPSGST